MNIAILDKGLNIFYVSHLNKATSVSGYYDPKLGFTDADEFYRCILQLEDDEYVENINHKPTYPKNPEHNFYKITNKGIDFCKTGGYAYKQVKDLNAELELQKAKEREVKKEELEIKQIQSNINTNEAIRKIGFRSLWLAGFSALFILGSIYFQATDKSAENILQIQKELNTTRKSIESLRNVLLSIDSSMKEVKLKKTVSAKILK